MINSYITSMISPCHASASLTSASLNTGSHHTGILDFLSLYEAPMGGTMPGVNKAVMMGAHNRGKHRAHHEVFTDGVHRALELVLRTW